MSNKINIEVFPVEKSRIDQYDFTNIAFGRVYSDHMFMADYSDDTWGNFRIQPYDYLKFMPGTAIFHYGQSVFEGMKAYKSENGDVMVFRPIKNFERLNRSAERMCIPQISEDIFMQGLTELLKLDSNWVPGLPNTSLYIRPYIFATDEYIGIRPSSNFKFIIFTCPVGQYYSKPVKVKIESNYTRAVRGGTGFAKAGGNYAASLYPARLAQKQGYDQLLWTDGLSHKYVEEAGTMNVMFVIDDKIVTADTGDTVLPGITRDSVLTLAKDWGLTVEERNLSVEELIDAIKTGRLKEAFGTGTAATIANIELIAYEDTDYKLPEITEDSISSKILSTLNAIRTGKTEDIYGWNYKI